MKKLMMILAVLTLGMGAASAQYGRPGIVVVQSRHNPYQPPRDVGYDRYNPYGYGRWGRNNYFGLRLGLNLANVRSDANALNGSSMKTGVNVGLAAGFGLSRVTPIYLETGLYYTQKGGKSDNVETLSGKSKFTYDLGYLEVPLVLKYKYWIPSTRNVTIEPYAGGFVAVGVAGQIKDYGNRQAFSSYENGYFNRMDGGIKLGLGVGFGIGYADITYDIGLANIGRDSFDNTHTGCLSFNLGVNF